MSLYSTVDAYENNIGKYVNLTPDTVDGDMRKWLNEFIYMLEPDAHVFEIGSGTGRDAEYLHQNNVNVFCSDATPGFVEYLFDAGLPAVHFDVLKDSFPGAGWQGVLANAVLLHFTVEETYDVLRKVYSALKPEGIFAFSLKKGSGNVWSSEKLGEPRFFQYWSESDITYAVLRAGFSGVQVAWNNDWIFIVAVK